jgi:hypothetical protein
MVKNTDVIAQESLKLIGIADLKPQEHMAFCPGHSKCYNHAIGCEFHLTDGMNVTAVHSEVDRFRNSSCPCRT